MLSFNYMYKWSPHPPYSLALSYREMGRDSQLLLTTRMKIEMVGVDDSSIPCYSVPDFREIGKEETSTNNRLQIVELIGLICTITYPILFNKTHNTRYFIST